jgi:hypothetical protein
MAQLFAGEKRDLQTGKARKVDWKTTMGSFFENKMAPLAGTAKDFFLKGKTRKGEAIGPRAIKEHPGRTAAILARDLLVPISVEDFHRIITEDPQASLMIPLMLLGANMSPDEPLGLDTWAKTDKMKGLERTAREELKLRHLPTPKLGTEVTLPGRNALGVRSKYKLSNEEQDELAAQYMPQITELLVNFINSKAYRELPESRKALSLHKKVLALQRRFSVNRTAKKKVWQKFKSGEIKPTNVVPEE